MNRRLLLPLACVLGLLPALSFATPAGQVLFATGQVTAERAPPAPLAKGDDVLVSDTVRTGAASRAQLRMLDGAKVAIRPESALRIEEFVFQAAASGQAESAVATRGDRSVTRLLKGGFRTITGAIGKDDEQAYEVRTPVGVLGIRGTDYSAVFCNGDCAGAPGATSSPPEDGLYLACHEGIIFFRNEVGDIELRAGQYAFIPLTTRRPERLSLPPPVLIDGPEFEPDNGRSATPTGFDSRLGSRRRPAAAAATADDGSPAPGSGEETPEQPVTGVDPDGQPVDLTGGQAPVRQPPPPPGDRQITWTSGPLTGAQSFAFAGVEQNTPSQWLLDANGDLTGFANQYPARQGSSLATFDIASSAVAESGGDSLTVMRWGRWAGGTAGITVVAAGDADQDLSLQSLHWVLGPEFQSAPVMPVSGVASYSLIGATSPTDAAGNVGVLGAATFDADFTNLQVTSTLTIDVNQQQWQASGTGLLGSQLNPVRPDYLFEGTYDNVSLNGIGGGTGVFSGFFSEPGPTSDPAFPGGVGLTYTLFDGQSFSTVSGAAVFGNP